MPLFIPHFLAGHRHNLRLNGLIDVLLLQLFFQVTRLPDLRAQVALR